MDICDTVLLKDDWKEDTLHFHGKLPGNDQLLPAGPALVASACLPHICWHRVMVSNSLGNLPEDLEDQGLAIQQLGGEETHDFVENFPNQPGPGGQREC